MKIVPPADPTARFSSSMEQATYQRLLKVGWTAEDILVEPLVSTEGRRIRPDALLLHNLYPLAFLETMGMGFTPEDFADQILEYHAQEIAPFTLVTDGNIVRQFDNATLASNTQSVLPSPQLLWEALGRVWDEKDPRLTPPLALAGDIRPYQAAAIGHVLDHISAGNRRAIITMATGTGRAFVLMQILWKLVRSGKIQRALVICDRTANAVQIRDVLNASGLHSITLLETVTGVSETAAVHFTTRGAFKEDVIPDLPGNYYDLVVSFDVHDISLVAPLLDHFGDAMQILFVYPNSRIFDLRRNFGSPVYKVASADATTTWVEKPPQGFYAAKLDAIAETKSGLTGVREYSIESQADSSAAAWLVTGRHLRADGSIDLGDVQPLDITGLEDTDVICSRYSVLPNDILMTSYWTGSENIKVTLIPNGLPPCTIFANRLIRIRVTDPQVDPQDLYAFLRSDTWLLQIRQLSASTVQTRFSLRDIRQLRVFLPAHKNATFAVDPLSAPSQAIVQIRRVILPLLEQAEQASSDETTQAALQSAASELGALAATLVGQTLEERVLTNYPMPIALAYRRFQDAKFNVYEQVLRLRDLAEATSYFIYNLVLADRLRRLDPMRYYVQDSGARTAYNGFSMAARLDCVEAILQIATQHSSQRELFTPELVGSKFVDLARQVQDDFRNRISHTATASESQQKNLLAEFLPIVEAMLEELDFLPKYRLVQVPSMEFRRGQLVRRVIVYSGTTPTLDEEPLQAMDIVKAEYDHVVLLNIDDELLDLYPMCQLLANKDTRYETHLCFLKQRKKKDARLEGESVQGAFTVDLDGLEDFERFQVRIADKPITDGT